MSVITTIFCYLYYKIGAHIHLKHEKIMSMYIDFAHTQYNTQQIFKKNNRYV